MKKILVFLVMLVFGVFAMGGVLAVDTASYLGNKDTGQSSISQLSFVSAPNSAKLYAPFNNAVGPEGRVRIEFPKNDFTLNDLSTLSWKQYVSEGYLSHVDVFLDNGKTLVFEGAKVNPSHCDEGNYPTGVLTTFGSTLGEQIDNNSYAWLSSGPAGPCGGDTFEANHNPLSEWKTTDGTSKVLAMEFEADGWIMKSEAYLDDITLNGIIIENFDNQDTLVNIGDVIRASITPLTLNFGTLLPGSTGAGPNIGIDVSGSNANVKVEISGVTGFPFETGLKVNDGAPTSQSATFTCSSVGGSACTYTTASWTTSLSIPNGTPAGLKKGTIIYTITGATP